MEGNEVRLLARSEYGSVPVKHEPKIPSEFIGKARDYLRRSKTEYDIAGKQTCALLAPIMDRYERYPLRNQRPELIDALVKQWDKLPSKFRLHCGIQRKKSTQLEIFEIRVAQSNIRHDDWAEEFKEPNLCIANVLLTLGVEQISKRVRFKPLSFHMTHIISMHAVGRRYQRYPQCVADDDILADIRCLLEVQPDRKLADTSIVVGNERGEWRGQHMMVAVRGDPPHPCVAIRTFV